MLLIISFHFGGGGEQVLQVSEPCAFESQFTVEMLQTEPLLLAISKHTHILAWDSIGMVLGALSLGS